MTIGKAETRNAERRRRGDMNVSLLVGLVALILVVAALWSFIAPKLWTGLTDIETAIVSCPCAINRTQLTVTGIRTYVEKDGDPFLPSELEICNCRPNQITLDASYTVRAAINFTCTSVADKEVGYQELPPQNTVPALQLPLSMRGVKLDTGRGVYLDFYDLVMCFTSGPYNGKCYPLKGLPVFLTIFHTTIGDWRIPRLHFNFTKSDLGIATVKLLKDNVEESRNSEMISYAVKNGAYCVMGGP